MKNTKIQSYPTFKRNHRFYHKRCPILNLDYYGYHEIDSMEYDAGINEKPKVIAKQIAELFKCNDVVYRVSNHSWRQPWITTYGKFK